MMLSSNRMALEHGWLLELAADAHHGDFGFVVLGQVDIAIKEHFAVVWPRLAGDDIHHGCLAGAVRANNGAHLALVEHQREIVDGAKAIEGNRYAVEVENGVAL